MGVPSAGMGLRRADTGLPMERAGVGEPLILDSAETHTQPRLRRDAHAVTSAP
ncbi:hypothetical protein GCM10027615_74170 [Plantactinospora veratri]